ncbi:MAG TPA: hypothetical protein VFV72_03815 [Candidatus Limnocylindrales bacterium]|nr:hypothetical protein [Candidatus Limnocylindrales bacterium]
MMQALFAAGAPVPAGMSVEYRPGVCNIGPAEVARRRRAGHAGLIATIVLFAVLVAIGAPPIARLLLVIPAAVSASGYLQAYLKFCAGFGARGVYNFGDLGPTEKVGEAAARALDRAKATRISLASFAIGAAVAFAAALLPI